MEVVFAVISIVLLVLYFREHSEIRKWKAIINTSMQDFSI